MTYKGTVRDGVVVLEPGAGLPDGQSVEVRPVPADAPDESSPSPSLYERLKDVVGTIKDLPPDAARNKRHYLYGHAKP